MGPQNLYWLQAVLAAAMALFASAYLWRHRSKPSARLLMALLMEVAVWAAAYSLECVSQDLSLRLCWVRLEYVGAALMAPTFLAFCLCVAGLERWVSWRRFWPLFLLPLLTVSAAWTNSWHHLFWEQAWLELGGPAPFTAYRRGPWFWVHCTYSHLLFMVGALFLLRALWRSRHAHVRQLVMAVIGLAAAWTINLLNLLEVEPFRSLDLTPLALGLMGLFFTLSLFRARLLDLIPLAREALMENLRDPVLVLDRRDRLVDMNPAARTLLGPAADRLIGRPAAEMFPEQPAFAALLASALEAHAELELSWRGAPRACEVSVELLRDLRGNEAGRYLILRDINQRRLAQEELRRNEERYRTTFEHTGTAMLITGGDGVITTVNTKFAELAGYGQDEIQGKMCWSEFVHPEDLERMRFYNQCRREGQAAPRAYEFRFRDRRGKVRWLVNTVEMIPGSDLAVASLLDVNDRKLGEERERARLRRLQKQRATLVALATHAALAEGDLRRAARVASEAAARALEVEWASVWLLDADGRLLHCLDLYGLSRGTHGELADVAAEKHPRYMRALQSERSIAVHDSQRDPRTSEFYSDYLEPNGIVSTLSAAIRLSGEVRGLISFDHLGRQREWADDEIGFAAEMADQLAQALLNQGRRQAQEALEISYQRYSTFMKSLPDPVVVYDMEGRVQYLNPAFEETFGWTSEELLNRRIDFVPPQCREATEKAIQVLLKGRQLLNFSTSRLTKDGRLLDMILSNSPFYDAHGRQAGNIVILRDVSALNQAQAQLRESEERYRSLVENTPYGLFLADLASGRFIFLNRQLIDMFGYEPEDTDSLTLWEVIDSSEHELVQKRLTSRGKGESVESDQVFTGRRKNGSLIRCLVSASPVSSGGQQALQGVVRDVTNEELMERQLQQAQKMEAVGTLAGGVAHEFNNLLMAIRGYSQLLTRRPDLEPEMRGHLEKIAQTTERAADLTQTMLSFSRPETGRKEPVDLNETMRNVQKLLLRTLPPNIEQRLELTPHLPLLKANPNQLEQVLLNLAVNARDAMPQGGTLTLRTAWRRADEAFRATHNWAREDEYGVLVVEDNGQGMGRSVQARVFEPFYTTKEPGKGTGLGLFVAYSLITNHGGGLEVISAPGAGTAFRVYLPAEPVTAEAPAPPREPPTPALGRGERILVVDDEAYLRDITRQALETYNYQVSEAANGSEALERYQAGLDTDAAFALVLMDMAMPVMDGATCFNRILALDPAAKMIITTGHVHSNAGLEQLAAQPAGMIRKPFDLSDLLKEVRQALDAPRP
ncbi:hypothetical protein AAU61_03470 [Desulfocarbo indianensis]|nr:hypothetical protein AAU61_03470 [Desulfocarbo indianensis]